MARKWTVMVYLGADNNLSVDFLWNLKEMQEVDKVGPRNRRKLQWSHSMTPVRVFQLNVTLSTTKVLRTRRTNQKRRLVDTRQ